jgi:hypothetical protein
MQQASTINRPAVDGAVWLERAAVPARASAKRLAWRRGVAKVSRWLHIYGSMASLALVLFFAVTGITLNHQDWFAGQEATSERAGTMSASWLLTGSDEGVDRLQVVEYLRSAEGLRGAVGEFRIDSGEVEVVFKGPGYAASAVVDRATGRFDITESRMGVAALVNDLHKGRDTGKVWGGVIDLSAALLVFISVTGLVLLYFVHKYRFAGILLIGAGAAASYLLYAAWVP